MKLCWKRIQSNMIYDIDICMVMIDYEKYDAMVSLFEVV